MNINDLVIQLKDIVSSVPDNERARCLALATGYIAAYSIPVFADKDELSAEAVYVREAQTKIAKTLGKLNNVMVIGLSDALTISKLVWCMRYRLVHEPTSPEAMAFLGNILRDQVGFGLSDVVELTHPVAVMEIADFMAKMAQETE